ncbi:MAG: hypothetical protein GF317_09765 [Candidatus Lokiarchaeota archaeon]|nr:hypothetical protein [Candidatus Lokiarchaeota archaeon]
MKQEEYKEYILSEEKERQIIRVLNFVGTKPYFNYWDVSDMIEIPENDTMNSAIVEFYEILLDHFQEKKVLGEWEHDKFKSITRRLKSGVCSSTRPQSS